MAEKTPKMILVGTSNSPTNKSAESSYEIVRMSGFAPKKVEVTKNIKLGQVALARAKESFTRKGVTIKVGKGIPTYQANPNNPKILIRSLNGKIDEGVFEGKRFKVVA